LPTTFNTSLSDVLDDAQWQSLETHLDTLKERIDTSIEASHAIRNDYRNELLTDNPDLINKIARPSKKSLESAQELFRTGIIAASDGTVSPVPLLSGSKIQIGVVIVSNRGDVVDLVSRVFETELISDAKSAREYFKNLRSARSISNLLSRAIMLYGERKLLFEHTANWRFIHGELIPYELRTGAGKPAKNLPSIFA